MGVVGVVWRRQARKGHAGDEATPPGGRGVSSVPLASVIGHRSVEPGRVERANGEQMIGPVDTLSLAIRSFSETEGPRQF